MPPRSSRRTASPDIDYEYNENENDINDNDNDLNDNDDEMDIDNDDDETNKDTNMEVINNEYQTPNNPNGDLKINKFGDLLINKKFKMKTFTLPNDNSNIKYSISTDVARLVGYRDSYFLFQKHTNLFRFTIDDETKLTLINDDYLPNSFKTRPAYLITARSAFKEFGHRLIINGKPGIDDYYDQNVESTTNTTIPNPTITTTTDISNPITKSSILETENSWIYDHSLKCRQFDSMLLFDRNELLNKRVQKDIYTNLNFTPSITQSTNSKFIKIGDSFDNKIKIDTLISDNNLIKTGLKDIPLSIFQGTVDDETLNAILFQQSNE